MTDVWISFLESGEKWPVKPVRPVMTKSQWCHRDCYDKWAALEPNIQWFIGGHIHYNKNQKAWRTPGFAVTLEQVPYCS